MISRLGNVITDMVLKYHFMRNVEAALRQVEPLELNIFRTGNGDGKKPKSKLKPLF